MSQLLRLRSTTTLRRTRLCLRRWVSTRHSELDIPMLAPNLRQGVFPRQKYGAPATEQIKIAIDHLKSQDIYGKEAEPVSMSDFSPPPLIGNDIDAHFRHIGKLIAEPYLTMAKKFVESGGSKAPERPLSDQWVFQSGWTRYGRDGSVERVQCPDPGDECLVFDVEVLVPESPYSVLATAVSETAWYGWVSPYLTGESPHPRHLIPIQHPQSQRPRIIIGHNIGYDRARIQEERQIKRPPTAFLDTMSLHVSSGGLCNQQRLHWVKYSKAKREQDEEFLKLNADTGKFFDVSSLNSLKEVALHYCGITMDKSRRNVFVDGTLSEIRAEFQDLMDYCACDVEITLRVFLKVLPAFLRKCPHPVSFAGMLMMSEGYLPVDKTWTEYVQRSENLFEQVSTDVEEKLRNLAEEALKVEDPMKDPWLKNLDWTIEPQKYTKPKFKKDGTYAKNGEPRPYTKQLLPGYPKWYREIWDRQEERVHVTVRSRVAPYLLKLKWIGYPLYHSALYGWTFCVPRDHYDACMLKLAHPSTAETHLDLPAFINMRPLEFPLDPESEEYEPIPARDREEAVYFKVPHKDGESANCGNPLAKGYQTAIDDGTLTSTYAMAKEAMEMNAMSSYWTSARERIKSQFVTWDNDVQDALTSQPLSLGLPSDSDNTLGVILPMVVAMGTITRRGVESTWMTASNAKKNRIGSELKSMIRSPPGYCFVGADVDSEELWISALIGDSQFRMHGATAFGWMTLQGTKAAGTDLHSNTARILGIGRGSAKVFNYGRIYGAGVKYATSLLLQFNPDMTEEVARQKADQLYAATKGTSMRNKTYFGRPFWHGGTESYMFNALEAIATSDDPRTPVLGCGITDALRKEATGDRFMTSRVNWVVQSSGVDYLHLLLVAVSYLARRYTIDMRFMISVHDEVRYIVADRDKARASLALQIANLWVRCLFSYRLGIEDLPQSVAFFSAVDVDHVLRKEVDMECVTPTNPTPIPPGFSLGISEILDMTNGGQLDPPSDAPAEPSVLSQPIPLPTAKELEALAKTDPAPLQPPSEPAQELPPPRGIVTIGESMVKSKRRSRNSRIPMADSVPWISKAPDSVWLTAQMLNDNAEVKELVHAMKRSASDPRSPRSKRTGVTEVRRIAR